MAAHRLAPAGIHRLLLYIVSGAVAMGGSVGRAQDSGAQREDSAALAKKLANPVVALMSLPSKYSRNENLGTNDVDWLGVSDLGTEYALQWTH